MFKRLIKAIEFSISSYQDVLIQSVVEVLHGRKPLGQKELYNTLYDLRMGTIEKGVKCETCSMDSTKCKGPLWSHYAGRACCQSHLLKTTQMDSEAYLQEM